MRNNYTLLHRKVRTCLYFPIQLHKSKYYNLFNLLIRIKNLSGRYTSQRVIMNSQSEVSILASCTLTDCYNNRYAEYLLELREDRYSMLFVQFVLSLKVIIVVLSNVYLLYVCVRYAYADTLFSIFCPISNCSANKCYS